MLIRGLSIIEIGTECVLSGETVEPHVGRILSTLEVHGRLDASELACGFGLFEREPAAVLARIRK